MSIEKEGKEAKVVTRDFIHEIISLSRYQFRISGTTRGNLVGPVQNLFLSRSRCQPWIQRACVCVCQGGREVQQLEFIVKFSSPCIVNYRPAEGSNRSCGRNRRNFLRIRVQTPHRSYYQSQLAINHGLIAIAPRVSNAYLPNDWSARVLF